METTQKILIILAIVILLIVIFFLFWKRKRKLKDIKQTIHDMKQETENILSDEPRGIRNNNPFNIRYNSANNWQGKIPYERNTDKVFEQFETPENGIRAGMKLLLNYYGKGYKTVKDILSRYAPPNENDTTSYINNVVSRLQKAGFEQLDETTDLYLPYNKLLLIEMSKAIIKSENGKQPYTNQQFETAYNMI